MTDQTDRLTAALAARYAIETELGAGGMATVYLAQDLKHRRKVAVKVLRPELAAALGPERFVREIEIAARLEHPHILALIDSGEADGFLYYVMPFVDGESLRERLHRDGSLPIEDCLHILRDVLGALGKAHAGNVVHRDIKPDNIMLSDGHARVMDFGVAKAVSEATGQHDLTSIGVSLGTPTYMAPEQAAADPLIDHRADLYAVGVVAYEMLTGRPPFQGTTQQEILAAHVLKAPEPVASHRDSVPPALADAVMRSLAKRPVDRWQTAEDMLHALAQVTGAVGPQRKTSRPKSVRGLAWAAVLILTTVALAWWGINRRPAAAVTLDTSLVAVFPFAVTGPSDMQYLGEGVVNLFESNLASDDGVRSVLAQTAINAWRSAGGEVGRTEVSDEVARRLGAAQFVTGNVTGSGARLVINASLTSLLTGDVSTATQSGAPDSVASLVGRLIAQLFSLQAGIGMQTAAALADVPLPALRMYLEGQIAYRRGDWQTAWQQFGRAIEADSTFALAGMGHAMTSEWTLGSSPGWVIAWENRDRLPERDRRLVEVRIRSTPHLRGEIQKWEAAVQGVLGERVETWYYLGDLIFHNGSSVGMTPDQVRQRTWAAFEQGLAIDPTFGPIVRHKFDQAFVDLDLERYLVLRDSFPDVAASFPEGALAAAAAEDDSAAIDAWFDGADEYSASDMLQAGTFAEWLGDSDAAIRATREGYDRAATEPVRGRALEELQFRHWVAGQPRAAANVANRMEQELLPPPDSRFSYAIYAALFMGGDPSQAEDAVVGIDRQLAEYGVTPDGGLPDPGVSLPNTMVTRLCNVGLWRVATNDTARVRRVAGQLRASSEGSSFSNGGVCALALEALIAPPAIRRELADSLDAIMAVGPDINANGRNKINLVLAELFGSDGQPRRALRAAMRNSSSAVSIMTYQALWREAGRYALLVEDSALAAYYLEGFLRPRDQAEPEQRALDDQLRAQLADLLGEPRR